MKQLIPNLLQENKRILTNLTNLLTHPTQPKSGFSDSKDPNVPKPTYTPAPLNNTAKMTISKGQPSKKILDEIMGELEELRNLTEGTDWTEGADMRELARFIRQGDTYNDPSNMGGNDLIKVQDELQSGNHYGQKSQNDRKFQNLEDLEGKKNKKKRIKRIKQKKSSNRQMSKENNKAQKSQMHSTPNKVSCERQSSRSQGPLRGPYRQYSPQTKQNILSLYKCGVSCLKISRVFDIPSKNIIRWCKNGVQRKTGAGRKVLDPQMQTKLMQWLEDNYRFGSLVLVQDVRRKAKEFSFCKEFSASHGWFKNFVNRFKLKQKYIFK